MVARSTRAQRWLEGRHTKSAARWARVVNDAPTIDDLLSTMTRRLPPVVREYVSGGADNEQTLCDNVEASKEGPLQLTKEDFGILPYHKEKNTLGKLEKA